MSHDPKLYKACREGDIRKVRSTLEAIAREPHADIPAKLQQKLGIYGYTPLHESATEGHHEVLRFLIEQGGNVDAKASNGYTPLHLAASGGHVECVKVLLEHGANINEHDDFRKTAINTAELGARTRVVRVLKSADIIRAVEKDSPSLDKLLKTPRDELEPDCLQRALMVAVEKGNPSSAGKLISKGREAVDIEIALTRAKQIHAYAVQALLLMVTAAYTDDFPLVLALFGENGNSGSSPMVDKVVKDSDFPHIQAAVRNGEVLTHVPIDIARRRNSIQVREELLMRTDVIKVDFTVNWFGLRLTELEIAWLKRIRWVEKLRLAHNSFSTLPPQMGNFMKYVTFLDLERNVLKTIPRCLLELPAIEELYLAHNCLEEIPDVHEWATSLALLDLSHNQLQNLPQYCEAPKLKILNLGHNKFRRVPQCVCSFTSLQRLEVNHNPDILNLPVEMGRLTNLILLNLDGLNDINDPPKTIRYSAKLCITYLNQKLRSTRGYYRMKLILVGKQAMGKTTLVARLQGKDVKETDNESTVGIDVSEWRFSPRIGKQTFTFNIWDFGGQEEYYATHQCFLTNRSLYLLLWNITDGEKGIRELKPWLDNIALRAPNSMVIIVATFYDKVSEKDQEEGGKVDQLLKQVSKLAQSYQRKLQVKRVTCVALHGKQLQNLDNLKKTIYEEAESYTIKGEKVMGRQIPASYHALDSHLAQIQKEVRQNKRYPIMHAPEFREMISSLNLSDISSDEEVKAATLFLHEVGSLLHYDDRKNNLDDLYFVDPRWLCDMMSTVVAVPEKNPFVRNGILPRMSLSILFHGKLFPLEYLEQYLVLLDRFEIALPLDQGKNRILVPSMLPDVRPTGIEPPPDEVCYQRHIIFSVPTPPGFWSRLLSRVIHSVDCIKALLTGLNAEFISVCFEEMNREDGLEQESKPATMKTARMNTGERQPSDAVPRRWTSAEPSTFLYNKRSSMPHLVVEGSSTICPESSDLGDAEPRDKEGIPPATENPVIPISAPQTANLMSQPMLQVGNAALKYWKTGMCYSSPSLYFRVEELERVCGPGQHGAHIVVSPSGCQVYGQIIDLIAGLVEEWYPGLTRQMGGTQVLEQRVLCYGCLKQGITKPHCFQRENLVEYIIKGSSSASSPARDDEDSMDGPYIPIVPCPQGHDVSLLDLAPDLLLLDIHQSVLLDEGKLDYTQDDKHRLGVGAYGAVYCGRYGQQSVAIKVLLAAARTDPLGALTDLRNEAQILHRTHHPSLVCMVGVLIFPQPCLVMEEAPMGSLEGPLIKHKVPISRIVLFRMAVQIVSALKHLHSLSYIYRDLKASNVLLWSLDMDQLINCKLADFGITTLSAPIGVRGARGTEGFQAPEVIYVGANQSHATYDFQADIFSYAMVLFQMISRHNPFFDTKRINIASNVEQGKRPRIVDFPVTRTGFHFMTGLMKRCWKHNPTNRPTTDEAIQHVTSPRVQLTMGVHHLDSQYSLRSACCYISKSQDSVPSDASEFPEPPMLELWVCCDNSEGAELSVFEAHSMNPVRKPQIIEDHQVKTMAVCKDSVWVASRIGLDFPKIDIYSIKSHQPVHRIRMKNTTVSCITCSETNVYVGTMEGFIFIYRFPLENIIKTVQPDHRCLTELCIDGMLVCGSSLWISYARQLLLCHLRTMEVETFRTLPEGVPGSVGQLILNDAKTLVWSVHLGCYILCAWQTQQHTIKFTLDAGKALHSIAAVDPYEACISAACTALDTVWCGMATGHILVFSEEQEFLLHFHPYKDYVRFLTVIPSTGPCGKEECMVLSGGKRYLKNSYLEDVSDDANAPDSPAVAEEVKESTAGTVILWEALQACHMRQVRMLSKGDAWTSHEMIDKYQMEWEESVQQVTAENKEETKPANSSSSEGSVDASIKGKSRRLSFASDEFMVVSSSGLSTTVRCLKPVLLKKLVAEISATLKLSVSEVAPLSYQDSNGRTLVVSNQELLGHYLSLKDRPALCLASSRKRTEAVEKQHSLK